MTPSQHADQARAAVLSAQNCLRFAAQALARATDGAPPRLVDGELAGQLDNTIDLLNGTRLEIELLQRHLNRRPARPTTGARG